MEHFKLSIVRAHITYFHLRMCAHAEVRSLIQNGICANTSCSNELMRSHAYPCLDPNHCNIQGVSQLYGITAGGDFLGFCNQKSSYKHASDFGRLRSYGRFLISVHFLV